MDSTQRSPPSSSPGAPLPPGFITVEQIQNLPSSKIMSESNKNVDPVSFVGFLKDYQPPRQTNGTNPKCCLEIIDSSLCGAHGIKVNIFWPEDRMPKIHGAGDVVLIRKVKPQMREGVVSLIANYISEFHIIPATKIPSALSGPSENLWHSYPPSKCKRPTATETAYIIQAKGNAEELALPSTMEFQEKSMQAMKARDKFSLLKDVEPDHFYDILGQVIKVYHGTFDSVTVYLSDYTANSKFHEHIREQSEASNGRDGDEHNYLKSRQKAANDAWPGPYGKMSIQLTLWDGHAVFVREQVEVNNWVLLRNVQIKYGKTGGCLEGFLRGDQYRFEGKVQVQIMKPSEEPDENASRWKEALARKLQWDTKSKQQEQNMLDETAGLKRKRKDETSKSNSKSRRKELRAAAEVKVIEKLGLNQNIRCSNSEEPTVLLADILKRLKIPGQTANAREDVGPFHVCKYKANVRVVGYFPPKIEDFSVGRRTSEFDMLSDYSGGEDTDPEEDMRAYRNGNGFPTKTWEWRFALEVVNASAKASNERMWLMVSNHDAQMLLDMDATNLRKDVDAFQKVKQQLCVLWGDLEEQNSALARPMDPKAQIVPSMEPKSSPPPSHKPGDQPPIDSDDEDEIHLRRAKPKLKSGILSERDLNVGTKGQADVDAKQQSSAELQIKNKAFTCCIKQYGVKVDEGDPSLANAGNGKRWERRFGLFGTKIA